MEWVDTTLGVWLEGQDSMNCGYLSTLLWQVEACVHGSHCVHSENWILNWVALTVDTHRGTSRSCYIIVRQGFSAWYIIVRSMS